MRFALQTAEGSSGGRTVMATALTAGLALGYPDRRALPTVTSRG